MQLEILLPSGVFASVADVERIVAMTAAGSVGLLPHRLDCIAVLSPGLLTYAVRGSKEIHIAVDAGVLVKTGTDVRICVRRAIAGADLGKLHQAVQQELMKHDEQETINQKALAQLQSGLIRALVELQRA